MKSKSLANVLIKILGLSICIYAIPDCIMAVAGVISWFLQKPGGQDTIWIMSNGIGGVIRVGVGIILICQSLKIAGKMFPNPEE